MSEIMEFSIWNGKTYSFEVENDLEEISALYFAMKKWLREHEKKDAPFETALEQRLYEGLDQLESKCDFLKDMLKSGIQNIHDRRLLMSVTQQALEGFDEYLVEDEDEDVDLSADLKQPVFNPSDKDEEVAP